MVVGWEEVIGGFGWYHGFGLEEISIENQMDGLSNRTRRCRDKQKTDLVEGCREQTGNR